MKNNHRDAKQRWKINTEKCKMSIKKTNKTQTKQTPRDIK